MSAFIKIGLPLTWLFLLLYWTISGFSAKQPQQQESFANRIVQYWLPLAFAFFLLGPGKWFGHTWLRENFVPHTNAVGGIGLSLCIFGAVIASWSRFLLGKNWSLSVQKKEDHELIQKGPYKLVRHPIYTGLLLMFIGNTLVVGDYRGLLAVAIVFVSFWFKLSKEEKWLTEAFGSRYETYRRQTKALIPYIL